MSDNRKTLTPITPYLLMLRPYQYKDLPKVLTFVGECLHESKLRAYHPGDIVHWMSNEQGGEHLDKTFWLYEEKSKLLALANLPFEKCKEFVLITHPDVQEPLELTLLGVCEEMIASRFPEECVFSMNVATTEDNRIRHLETSGYQIRESNIIVDILSLEESSPEITLPQGFKIRSVAGEHEASLLAEVHNSAFGSSWTAESYLKVMQTPGFDIHRELVVVAPDGSFASFLIYWLDPISQSGLFEPVGCHQDFQRKGLTKALILEAMQRMKDAGMKMALVGHSLKNEAANRLYASVGFKEHFKTLELIKHLSE